jgi:hypothetical protein
VKRSDWVGSALAIGNAGWRKEANTALKTARKTGARVAALLLLAVTCAVVGSWAVPELRAHARANGRIVALGMTEWGHTPFLYRFGRFEALTLAGVDIVSLAPSVSRNRIAFVYAQTAGARDLVSARDLALAVMTLSDRQLEVLIPSLQSILDHLPSYTSLAWSPNGEEILLTATYGRHDEEAVIYLLDVEARTTSPTPLDFTQGGCNRGIPCLQLDVTWSPGPDPLLSVCRLPDPSTPIDCRMYLLDVETWRANLIPADGWGPQWIPGTSEIAYHCSADDFEARTCLYSFEQGSSYSLPSSPSYGSWSPEGDYLAYVDFSGNVGTTTHVHLYEPRTGATFRLFRFDVMRPVLSGGLVWIPP